MKLKLIAIAAILLAGGVVFAEETPQDVVDLSNGLTLEEAVTLSLTESPSIRMASSGEAMAVARLRQAQSTWLPMVSISETFTRSNNPVFVFASLLEQGKFGPEHFDPNFLNNPPEYDNYRTQLTAMLPIFDQLRRWSTISQARLGVEQAELQSEMARQMLRYFTIRAYYGVLVADAYKDVADEAVLSAEADVKSIRDRYETGLLVESDLLAAEVQLADFRQKQIDAEGNQIIARKALCSVMGLPLDTELTIAGELLPIDFVIESRETLLTEGLERRQDVQIAALTTQQATLGKRIAGGQFLPRVDGFASWGASGTSISDQNDDHALGVVVSWNILAPGRAYRLSEARAGELASQASSDKTRDDAELDVESSYHRFLAAQQRVARGEKAAEQATETLRIVRDRYEQGLTTITEVLRAQTAAVGARLARLGSLYDDYVGYAGVLRATGSLTGIEAFLPGGQMPSSEPTTSTSSNIDSTNTPSITAFTLNAETTEQN